MGSEAEDAMKKPLQRYVAVFSKGREMAEMKIEAKSDRGAVRIAARYRFRDVGYLRPDLRLESVLRFNPASGAWEGLRALEVEVAKINRHRRAA